MTLRPHLDTLLLHDPDRSQATVNVWVAHPTLDQERTNGKIFLLSYLHQASRINYEIIHLIQEELKTTYYQTVDLKSSLAFEQTLQKINLRLHQLIMDGVSEWVQYSHFLAGVIHHDQLTLAAVGSMGAYLIRQGRIHDILNTGMSVPVNPLRIFEHVVHGQLQSDDRLLLCTPELLDYFSIEKLRRTVMDHTPSDAIRSFEESLLGVEHNIAFTALVAWLEPVTVPAPTESAVIRPPAPVTLTHPQRSMDELIAREQATEQLLSPSIWPSIRDVGQQLFRSTTSFVRTTILRRPYKRALSASIAARRSPRSSDHHPINLLQRGSRNIVKFFSLLQASFLAARRPRELTNVAALAQTAAASRARPDVLNRTVIWWQRLPKRQQMLTGSLTILVVLLAASVMVQLQRPAGGSTTPEDITAQVQDRIAKAEAALLYGGEESAHQHYTAAKQLIDGLPNRSKRQQAQRQPLEASLLRIEQRLSHLTIIDRPTLSLPLKVNNVAIQPTSLLVLDTNLVLLPSSSTHIWLTKGQSSSPIDQVKQTLDIGAITSGIAIGSNTVLVMTDRREFAEFDLAKKTWKPMTAAWPASATKPIALSFFQNRIYALDHDSHNIVRFARSSNGLGTGTFWVRETANFQKARALSVDGSIYVLQPGAALEVYVAGRKSSLQLTAITPPLTETTRMWTSPDTSNLYLLDPSSKRLVVFNKEGGLVDQYQSSRWNNLKDMAIDLPNKQAYVLFGSTVEQFPLLH